jgi:hypothetical protein
MLLSYHTQTFHSGGLTCVNNSTFRLLFSRFDPDNAMHICGAMKLATKYLTDTILKCIKDVIEDSWSQKLVQ